MDIQSTAVTEEDRSGGSAKSSNDDAPKAVHPNPVARKVGRAMVRRLLRYTIPFRSTLILALVSMVIYGATDGLVPLLIRLILDDVFGAKNPSMLYVVPVILIGFAFVRGGFGFAQQYLMASVGLGITRNIRDQIQEHLLHLSPSFFDRHASGSLVSRVTNDTLLVRQAITDAMTSVLRDTVRVIALLATALYLDPLLGTIAFIAFPLGIIPVLKFGKKVRKLSRVGQDQFGGLTGALQESIAGNQVIQSYNLEAATHGRFLRENEQLTRILRKAEKYGALSGPTNELIASIAIGGIVLYGGLSVVSGVRTQGDFIAFLTALFLLYEPLKKLGRANTTFQIGMSAAERIFEILDTPPEISNHPSAQRLTGPYNVHFEHVWFRYPVASEPQGEPAAQESSERWVLRDVSLEVQHGETVALVGMSGGGKSTLVRLLPRFYDPQRGRVTVAGIELRHADLHDLRRSIAIVSQHTFLFHDTIRENIRFGRLDATSEEIERAARDANAMSFIEALPQGLNTSVGEQGFRLSGGERARIALARALLKDAPILILDEATAALDSESESLIQNALDRLMVGRTVLVIAHRLSTIRKASRIAVVIGGEIRELGSHDELLQREGEYAKLYRIQFRDQSATEGSRGRSGATNSGEPATYRSTPIDAPVEQKEHDCDG